MRFALRITPYALRPMVAKRETRRLSAAVFGNEKWIEVALALDAMGGTPIAQEVGRRIGINSDLVTKVLRRMHTADLVKPLPRIGSASRGIVPWEVQPGTRWDSVLALCRVLVNAPSDT